MRPMRFLLTVLLVSPIISVSRAHAEDLVELESLVSGGSSSTGSQSQWPTPPSPDTNPCNVGGNNPAAQQCGTHHPDINYPADPGSCKKSGDSVTFTIWGCQIVCSYQVTGGSSRAGSVCLCTIISCPPELNIEGLPKKLKPLRAGR